MGDHFHIMVKTNLKKTRFVKKSHFPYKILTTTMALTVSENWSVRSSSKFGSRNHFSMPSKREVQYCQNIFTFSKTTAIIPRRPERLFSHIRLIIQRGR